ncbi:MAG: rod shape-determining protein [Patescibacteria group bacterium]|nr:rod shape-determining protein [Patescibacteria group bacterium]
MFKKLLGHFIRAHDMGIDMGTVNTLVYVRDKGIVINEPSVVAINTKSDQILAIGDEAKKMLGKTPEHILATRPLERGVISDFEATEKMIHYFIDKVHQTKNLFLPHPRIVTGLPLDVTEVEKKAVEDAILQAGAQRVYLVEEPLAAAVGAHLPIEQPTGYMIVDLGGGTTKIAVISLGSIVSQKSIDVAGQELNKDIVQYAQDELNILLGEETAERLKIKIGSAVVEKELKELKVRGRDLNTGLPREIVLNEGQVLEAINRSLRIIVDNIKYVLEVTPPELVSDIYERGLFLSGGGALLRNIDQYISQQINIQVNLIDDPLTAVVRGTGAILENLETLKEVLIPSAKEEAKENKI